MTPYGGSRFCFVLLRHAELFEIDEGEEGGAKSPVVAHSLQADRAARNRMETPTHGSIKYKGVAEGESRTRGAA